MPRSVSPEKWAMYLELVRTHGKTEAARVAGISMPAVRAFHAGDPRSSGVQWLRRIRFAAEEAEGEAVGS